MNKKPLPLLALLLAAGSALAAPSPQAQQLRWIPAGERMTLDAASRLALARSAADGASLAEVGLDFRDVYGVIHAETSWVPRTGMGRNGVASHGLGQFEPATARAVGLRDPNNAVEAVHAAARLLREAAVWSGNRIAGLKLAPEQRAAKLREGISIYYNLSTRLRSTWNGLNTDRLPVETLHHIRNVRAGAKQAEQLHARLGGASLPPLPSDDAIAVTTKAAVKAEPAKPAQPKAMGTIEWAGKPGEGRRSYVVFSDGKVQPSVKGEVPASAIQWTQRRVNG